MHSDLLFFERQSFRQKWLWLLFALSLLFVLLSLLNDNFLDHRIPHLPSLQLGVTSLLIILGVMILFWVMKLETMIKKDGIYFRFRPFASSYKHIPWSELDDIRVRTYQPIREYGGWGLRMGIWGKGMAFTISGTEGIQLVMKDGKRILIGTREPEKVKHTLEKIVLN